MYRTIKYIHLYNAAKNLNKTKKIKINKKQTNKINETKKWYYISVQDINYVITMLFMARISYVPPSYIIYM